MIGILYFASLRERLGCESENLEDLPKTLADLRAVLMGRGDAWGEVFAEDQAVLAAVNQAMATPEQTLADGDEVGFFPPVTGG